MDKEACELACSLVSKSYISQGQQALTRRHKQVKRLLSSRKMPKEGWDEASIESFLQDLAMMDSNNFLDNVGVGEREARVACPLVARRHYRMAHGIGRSGDVNAEQPKAAGSSLLVKVTNFLAADALHLAGLLDLGPVSVLPLATGMTLTLTLLALRQTRASATARYVLWSRIDQKTCLKCITAAGFEPVVIELQQEGDELRTDVEALQRKVDELGPDNVHCVITTTSCFAPRAPDDVVAVAKLCEASGMPHVINNAYGVQSAAICAQITSAWRKGRVDAVIQSTDKNFMVPVGGAIVACGRLRPGLVDAVNKLYPGRAAVSAHLDLMMTLLHLGASGWQQALQQREALFTHLKAQLEEAAQALGERVLLTPGNPISLAVTLNHLVAPSDPLTTWEAAEVVSPRPTDVRTHAVRVDQWHLRFKKPDAEPLAAAAPEANMPKPAASEAAAPATAGEAAEPHPLAAGRAAAVTAGAGKSPTVPAAASARPRGTPENATFLGSMLWARCISGTRVVAPGKAQSVSGLHFANYGSHTDAYPHAYLTAAAAIGTKPTEAEEFSRRLVKAYREFQKGKAGVRSRWA